MSTLALALGGDVPGDASTFKGIDHWHYDLIGLE